MAKKYCFILLILSVALILILDQKMPGFIVFAQTGTPLWHADHETGDMSQWYQGGEGDETNSGNAVSNASQDYAHTGRWSAKMTITAPPTSGVRLMRWGESAQYESLYYSAWLYFPAKLDIVDWSNIWQWKAEHLPSSDPIFVLGVFNRATTGNMYLKLGKCLGKDCGGGTVDMGDQTIADIPAGRWVHIETFHKCVENNTGRVVVWQDGVQLYDIQNTYTKYPNTYCIWSVNNYAGNIIQKPAIIYVDDVAISLSRIGSGSVTPTLTPIISPTQTPSPQPTSTPSPSLTPTLTQTPSPTPVLNCQQLAKQGDYNCSGEVNAVDFDDWLSDYVQGNSTLSFFEYWRRISF